MSEKYYRTTTMKVNLDAITENYYALTKLQPNKTMMPVVKANAYGLGSIQIAQHLSQLGAEFFCVATLDEAIELRMHGIKEKILILSSIPPDAINKAIQHRVAVTVPSRAWLEAATAEIDEDNEKTLWLHIKVDTGMNRLGVKDIEAYHDIINFIHAHENLVLKALSHIFIPLMRTMILHTCNMNALKKLSKVQSILRTFICKILRERYALIRHYVMHSDQVLRYTVTIHQRSLKKLQLHN